MFSFATFLITFRETLEAALVIGIILAYLNQIKVGPSYRKSVYWGIGGGILFALGLATLFETQLGGFEGRNEELFEGVTMLIAAALITWMIVWMHRQKSISKELRDKVQTHVDKERPIGIFLLTLLSVGREGIETVLFLNASRFAGEQGQWISGILGILLAIALGYTLFATTKKIPLKQFFTVSGLLLLLFAAGLIAHGTHELQEAGVLAIGTQEVWNTNGVINEKGGFGEILKGLFGYNGNPSLAEVVSYTSYLALLGWVYFKKDKKRNASLQS
ncbi:MAG: hypothetical protein ACD_28C00181G0008 [uncultured bacterium]|nr:MAG: hypothetical protein ACD_28C00181G0008 [uncultured bacterium]KKT75637.1 MAG: High-affinity iron transporter [Candidatus Peregrinibacteria bacterium GW2011_GWA2_44_7]